MSELMLLRASAPEPDAAASWCISSMGPTNPYASREPQIGTLSEALGSVGKRRLTLLIPSADVFLTSVNLRIKQTSKLLQAIPFALEERLADDPEALHFALGPKLPNGDYTVAVIAKSRMEAWQNLLQSQGVTAETLLPDLLCLPTPADSQATVLLEANQALVRTGIASGFVCAAEQLKSMLSLSSIAPNQCQVWHSDDATLHWDSSQRSRHVLDVMRGHTAPPAVNLLQGAYATQGSFQLGDLPILRWTAGLAAACFLLAIIGNGFTQWQLNAEREMLETELQTRMQQQFPEIRKIVDARVQAERALASLRQQGGGGVLYHRLTAFMAAMQAVPGFEVQTLQLRDNGLFFDLTGKDLQNLDKLKAHFESQPNIRLNVLSANASQGATQIRASLEAP